MRRVFKKCVAVALAAAMVVTLAPAGADAAKKPSLKKKASVKVGKTTTLKLKNGNKKAKVTWKSSKKKVAKITKQVKKGNKASAKVKGLKKGTAKITATYKLGKKTTKLTCKLSVKKNGGSNNTVATATPTVAPTATATAVPATATPTGTPKPTGTPRPTPTPAPLKKNTNLDAWQISGEANFAIDGEVKTGESWEDSKANDLLTDITKENGLRGGDAAPVTEAKATFMWGGKDVYLFLDAAGDADKVIVYYDENAKATKDTATKIEIPLSGDATSSNADYAVEAKAVKADGKFAIEAKITGKTDLAVDGSVSVDVQICKGDVTLNYYDTRSQWILNEETKEFELGDATVAVGEKPELMGPITLLPMMPPSTAAFYTDKGADILAASDIANKEFEPLEVAGADDAVVDENTEKGKTKKIDFVDPTFWTDCYTANGAESITFSKVNIPEWQGNPEKVGLATKDDAGNWVTDATYAQAYIMWDDDYVYVMFDVNDADISPSQAVYDDQYMTDSTEFFLDECGDCTSYDPAKDAVQLRISAADNRFSSNSAGTGCYQEVGHAVGYKYADGTTGTARENAVGYYTQYIIKLNEDHTPNTFMNMDVQINDCYTDAGTPAEDDPETEEDESAVAPTPIAARAATLTAYDTTNTAYENPAILERLKLIKKGVADEGGNDDAGDNGNEGGETELPDVLKLDLTKFTSNDNVTATPNDDGSVTLAWKQGAADWSATEIIFDTPMNLSGYTKYTVKTTDGAQIFCGSILDATKKSAWGAPAPVGLKYGFATNTDHTLESLKNADYNGDNEGGNDADFTNVYGVSFNKNNDPAAVTVTITEISFSK